MKKSTLFSIIAGIAILFIASLFIFGITDSFFPQKSSSSENLTSSSSDKLLIEDIKMGSGSAEVKKGDSIIIHYVGKLASTGKKFDSSYDRNQPFSTKIGVGQVIKGWDDGVLGMKIGGKRRLTIPPDLGYGSQGAGSTIPPNSTLIFDVELIGIN